MIRRKFDGTEVNIPWWISPLKWVGEKLGVPTLLICIFSLFAWYGVSWIGNELIKPFFITMSARHMEYLDNNEENSKMMIQILQTQENTLKEIQRELSTTNKQHETMISQQRDILDEIRFSN